MTFNANALNSVLQNMDIYSSKAISLAAKKNPHIDNLAFGEPFFGPPDFLLKEIENDLNLSNFLDATKRYEEPKGSRKLREAIANWYLQHYDLIVNPDTEIMITHGGVEAITLALLSITETNDYIAVTDPSYMLYTRNIQALSRRPLILQRESEENEFLGLLDKNSDFNKVRPKALIINSPENPTGYVLGDDEWKAIGESTAKSGTWVIHDEVYDVMSFKKPHKPARSYPELKDHSILINSFSKKFGLPGLRIGWLVAPPSIIELAAKIHDYMYLGVNILFERIAERIISHPDIVTWHDDLSLLLENRAIKATSELGKKNGFNWTRKPTGAMFLFPNIRELYNSLPTSFQSQFSTSGEAVAKYLFDNHSVAVVPGNVYGSSSKDHIRLVTCTPENTFNSAIKRLSKIEI